MIKLDSFKIKEIDVTVNWGCLSLLSTDAHSGKVVSLAACSFATGAIKDYPLATKEKAKKNVEKLQQYLIDNDIKTERDWTQKASNEAKASFTRCFDVTQSYSPFFSNEG